MKAFFVFDEKKDEDLVVIPEIDTMVAVSREIMEEFIAVTPDFSKCSGDRLNEMPPESLGVVVAMRKTDGDVCIVEEALWRQRMAAILGGIQ